MKKNRIIAGVITVLLVTFAALIHGCGQNDGSGPSTPITIKGANQ